MITITYITQLIFSGQDMHTQGSTTQCLSVVMWHYFSFRTITQLANKKQYFENNLSILIFRKLLMPNLHLYWEWVITNDQSKVHAKGQGQRSKVKVTEVTTQLNRFRTVTPVWIHIWWWNHAYGLMILRRGALLFLKVIRQISRSHDSKKRRVWPRLGVSGL